MYTPFTGKRFGSMDKLVSSAIPTLVQWAIAKKRRDTERQASREREKDNSNFFRKQASNMAL